MNGPYVIGIDFGTLSGRIVVIDPADGREVSSVTVEYPHGVMDRSLPSGKALPPEFALQDPEDYLKVLQAIPEVLKEAGVSRESIAGLGVDFTACTMLPVDEEGRPLCQLAEFKDEPHAYVKLWKHHGAKSEADEINRLAKERNESWLQIYGGAVSPEWMLPKILETLRNVPEVYEKTCRFTEAGDWISRLLTGKETHSAVFAGYKGLWNAETGYPGNEFMKELDVRLDGIVGTKLFPRISGMDEIAGTINEEGSALTGLPAGIKVSLPVIDAHTAMPAVNIVSSGSMALILGTSACHLIHSGQCFPVPGISGYVKDGVVPGLYTYEAGQAASGDIFDWFVHNGIPASYEEEAKARGIGIHKLLREKAMRLSPGESGLIALDWLNGNRSVLSNAKLSGMILGMTLQTKPEEIYRAWIEATAFGTRMILEQFEENGLAVRSITAAGGIAKKDEMLMQIYADVTGKEISVSGAAEATALGSAIYAATAAGIYPSLTDAAAAMSAKIVRTYRPDEANRKIYDRLYGEYRTLHDYFGRGGNDVMMRLREMKPQVL